MNQDFVPTRDHSVDVYFCWSVCWHMCREFMAFIVKFVWFHTKSVLSVLLWFISLPYLSKLSISAKGYFATHHYYSQDKNVHSSAVGSERWQCYNYSGTVASRNTDNLAVFRPFRSLKIKCLASGWDYQSLCVLCKLYGNQPVTLCGCCCNVLSFREDEYQKQMSWQFSREWVLSWV